MSGSPVFVFAAMLEKDRAPSQRLQDEAGPDSTQVGGNGSRRGLAGLQCGVEVRELLDLSKPRKGLSVPRHVYVNEGAPILERV